MKLIGLLASLAMYTKGRKLINATVSEGSIGWHIAHALLVINNVYNSLAVSNPALYVADENRTREYILSNEKIKRGIAKAPDTTTPAEDLKKADLKELFRQAKRNVIQLKLLPKEAFFSHHTMGHLNRKEAKKFLVIHTRHHLEIIKDIEKSLSKTH